jgi:hypothetical protein
MLTLTKTTGTNGCSVVNDILWEKHATTTTNAAGSLETMLWFGRCLWNKRKWLKVVCGLACQLQIYIYFFKRWRFKNSDKYCVSEGSVTRSKY